MDTALHVQPFIILSKDDFEVDDARYSKQGFHAEKGIRLRHRRELRQHRRRSPVPDLANMKSSSHSRVVDTGRLEKRVLKLYQKYMPSAMQTAAQGDIDPEGLLDSLECEMDRRENNLRSQKKRLQHRLNEKLEAAVQSRNEALEAVEKRDLRLSNYQIRVDSLRRISAEFPDLPKTTRECVSLRRCCSGLDKGMASLTQCQTILCEECNRRMQNEIVADDFVLQCQWCQECCSVFTLPKAVSAPWTENWNGLLIEMMRVSRMIVDVLRDSDGDE